MVNGLLVIDKPTGITSREVVNRLQRWFPRRTRIGHTGTLDPLATGVLVLCLGKATRLAEFVQALDKTYHTRIHLGAVSDTDDADGAITACDNPTIPEEAAIQHGLQSFIGYIEQVPPVYSAVKVSGRRAYDLARRGHETELRPRRVQIYEIKLLSYSYPLLELEIRCGKGTYIRSLARDIGNRLGCGGYVEMLRRTRVGPFDAAQGISPDSSREEITPRILPLESALVALPKITVSEEEGGRLAQGQTVLPSAPLSPEIRGEGGNQVAVFTEAGLIAVAVIEGAGELRPIIVLKVE